MKRVAIITETFSANFYFPIWYKYYSRQVSAKNLYVIAIGGSMEAFKDYELGGVMAIPSDFDEQKRVEFMNPFVRGLLSQYDIVIRVDVDEFLVPDPSKFDCLNHYLQRITTPYVTAIGIDVFQHTSEPPIDYTKFPLLSQRRFGYLTSSMCKTAVTSVPISWSIGFHYASVYPKFSELFLLHFKRLDISQQIAWFTEISKAKLVDPHLENYYRPDIAKIENFHSAVSNRPLVRGWEGLRRPDFFSKFFGEVALDRRDSIYRGKHFVADYIIELPSDFSIII